ncbi:MAG: ion channel [Pseudomonadota bacterium]
MTSFYVFLKQLGEQLKAEHFHRVFLALILLVLLGAGALRFFEPRLSFPDSLWWSIVTVTTVGYGDVSPATLGGRVVGVMLMMLGIGFLGVLTATIAGLFVENKIMENKGMKPVKVRGQFLICGWNYGGRQIVDLLRQDEKSVKAPIVVIADLPEKPVDDRNLFFIRGEVGTETLEMAGAAEADTAMVLYTETLDVPVRDAKSILDTLTLKSLFPDLYVCVELMEAKNVEHCQRAKADEIIVVGQLSSNLLAQAALDHGVTNMVSELVSRYGSELYKIDLPSSLKGRTFLDVMFHLKKEHDIICLGVEEGNDHGLVTNPKADRELKPGDRLVVIAATRPALA